MLLQFLAKTSNSNIGRVFDWLKGLSFMHLAGKEVELTISRALLLCISLMKARGHHITTSSLCSRGLVSRSTTHRDRGERSRILVLVVCALTERVLRECRGRGRSRGRARRGGGVVAGTRGTGRRSTLASLRRRRWAPLLQRPLPSSCPFLFISLPFHFSIHPSTSEIFNRVNIQSDGEMRGRHKSQKSKKVDSVFPQIVSANFSCMWQLSVCSNQQFHT